MQARLARWGPLALVLAVGLALRLWGLDYALPAIAHDDEWRYVRGAVSMLESGRPVFDLGGHPWTYINPTGFTLLALPFVAAADAWSPGSAAGDVLTRYLACPAAYHLAGRLASALAGLGAVALTYLAGARALGRRYGLVAAALLACSPLHVRESHFATNDACLSLWASLVLLGLVHYRDRPTRGWARILGAAVGAAVATKYTAVLLLAPVAWVLVREGDPRRRSERWVWAGVAAVGAFLALFPALLLEPGVVFTSLRSLSALAPHGWPGQQPGPAGWNLAGCLTRALGPLGLVLVGVGAASWARRRDWALLAYPALHVLAVVASTLFTIRYQLPVLPFLALAAAGGLRAAARRAPAWAAPLLALALLPLVWSSSRIAHLLAGSDTREAITTWVSARLASQPGPLRVATGLDGRRFLPPGPDAPCDPRIEVGPLLGGAPLTLAELQEARVDVVIVTAYAEFEPATLALDQALEREGTLALEALPTVGPRRLGDFDLDQALGPWTGLAARTAAGPWVRIYQVRLSKY